MSGHLVLKKELIFYGLRKLRKIVLLRIKFFELVLQLANPPTGTFRSWDFSQIFWSFENLSPPTAGTSFILCLFFLIVQISERLKIFLFLVLILPRKKKVDQFFWLKIIFCKKIVPHRYAVNFLEKVHCPLYVRSLYVRSTVYVILLYK